MQFQLSSGSVVHLIGDPHLGKNFDLNAPPARRGERAVQQMAHFIEELHADCDLNIMVGDLFDNPYVSQSVIVGAARAYIAAAEANPDTTFVAMAGNHDVPRNLSAVGAWVAFTKMLEGRLENVYILRTPDVIGGVACFPWEWDKTAEAQVLELGKEPDIEAVVGHWDLKQFGDDDSHMVPVEALRTTFGSGVRMFSGHFHNPGQYGPVTCTGSMEPYSHGEDADEELYVTRPLADILADPAAFRNKNVRVILRPGEELPSIDALSITHIRSRDDEEISAVTQSLGAFDWNKRLRERISKLTAPVRSFIVERMPDAAPEEQCRGSDSSV
jgi:hypothetical protein